MDDKPRNLKALLSDAKDTSELIVDLAYAALYFGDTEMAEEVDELAGDLHELASEARKLGIRAARSNKDAEAMSAVIEIADAMVRLGEAAGEIGRIVTHRLGIPAALVTDLAQAEEVSARVRVSENSQLAHRQLCDLELPTEVGMRVVAIKRGRRWITEVDGDETLIPDDVLFLQGSAEGAVELRALSGSPAVNPVVSQEINDLSDLDRAVDVLVEMKNISEVAVGLAYSAIVLRDLGLAAEVRHLEDRLDTMKERLERWVLMAARDHHDPSNLRGLLHLAGAAESIGDAAQQMVWVLEKHEDLHPVVAIGLGDADEISVRVPVAPQSRADGRSLGELRLETETGYYLLAIKRAGRYVYRPKHWVKLMANDELIATGPYEGHSMLAQLCGYRVLENELTGVDELVPVNEVLA